MRSVRVMRYMALSYLLMLLVKLRLKKYITDSLEVDLFHKRMGTPDNEDRSI